MIFVSWKEFHLFTLTYVIKFDYNFKNVIKIFKDDTLEYFFFECIMP